MTGAMSIDTTTDKTPVGPVGALAPLAVPIDTLDYLPGNPRRGDVPAVAASLTRFGQRKPIVAKRDGTVIAGNHTLEAARSLGWETIAVVYVDDDDATAKAFALADNRTAELGSYDDEALAELIAAVRDADEVLYGATGWTDADLDELVAKIEAAQPRPALTDPDEVPDQAPAITVPGDVWLLGPHRVACGDGTAVDVLDSVTDGERPQVVFTDPPYGIAYKTMRTVGAGAIANDQTLDVAQDVTTEALALVADADAHFVCCDWRSLPTILAACEAAGLTPKATIVWDKGTNVQNLDRFGKSYELIVYAGPFGGEPTVARDVWTHARDYDPDHPTPKPVPLIAQALDASARPGALVYDPFAGSGSTLIAAHQTGRRAALIELDPAYVDIICRRYQQHTGTLPINATTGKAHDFCA